MAHLLIKVVLLTTLHLVHLIALRWYLSVLPLSILRLLALLGLLRLLGPLLIVDLLLLVLPSRPLHISGLIVYSFSAFFLAWKTVSHSITVLYVESGALIGDDSVIVAVEAKVGLGILEDELIEVAIDGDVEAAFLDFKAVLIAIHVDLQPAAPH